MSIAADIVVNSNIMLENNMKLNSITLSEYGPSMNVAPDGKERYEYTAEQVYAILPKNPNKKMITIKPVLQKAERKKIV